MERQCQLVGKALVVVLFVFVLVFVVVVVVVLLLFLFNFIFLLSSYGTTVSACREDACATFFTFAHELGHNFAATHG